MHASTLVAAGPGPAMHAHARMRVIYKSPGGRRRCDPSDPAAGGCSQHLRAVGLVHDDVGDVPRVERGEARLLLELVLTKRRRLVGRRQQRGGVERLLDLEHRLQVVHPGLHAGDLLHHEAEVGGVGADVGGGRALRRPRPALPRARSRRRMVVAVGRRGAAARRVGHKHGVAAGGGRVRWRSVVVGRREVGEGAEKKGRVVVVREGGGRRGGVVG